MPTLRLRSGIPHTIMDYGGAVSKEESFVRALVDYLVPEIASDLPGRWESYCSIDLEYPDFWFVMVIYHPPEGPMSILDRKAITRDISNFHVALSVMVENAVKNVADLARRQARGEDIPRLEWMFRDDDDPPVP